MKTAEVLEHYGSQRAVAEALGISQPAVAGWGEYPPPLRQLQLQRLSRNRLRAEPRVVRPQSKPAAGE
jgi:predicted transcriptional regulator